METGGSKLVPALSNSWTVSDDGRIYTFEVRSGVSISPTRNSNSRVSLTPMMWCSALTCKADIASA